MYIQTDGHRIDVLTITCIIQTDGHHINVLTITCVYSQMDTILMC